MKKKKKGDWLITLILILVFLAGLSLLLYPSFSNWWNTRTQSQAISNYTDSVNSMESEKNTRMLEEAGAYNQALAESGLTDGLLAQYETLLDISGTGIMAYLEIPSLGVQLPVYHGTDEAALQVALGHLEWTSLPVGGESTHCVISGHRGLPSAELLTNLDQLEIGDVFYIYVLNETLTYVVDDISIVLPDETEKLQIFEGKDYVTLLTCTPYGINSHRLLVRGERVNTDDVEKTQLYIPNEVSEVSKIYLIPATLVLVLVVVYLLSLAGKLAKKLHPKKDMVNDDDNDKQNE